MQRLTVKNQIAFEEILIPENANYESRYYLFNLLRRGDIDPEFFLLLTQLNSTIDTEFRQISYYWKSKNSNKSYNRVCDRHIAESAQTIRSKIRIIKSMFLVIQTFNPEFVYFFSNTKYIFINNFGIKSYEFFIRSPTV
jgi:hypothetical protein